MAQGITKSIWSIEDLLTATIWGAYNRRARSTQPLGGEDAGSRLACKARDDPSSGAH